VALRSGSERVIEDEREEEVLLLPLRLWTGT
jgi:hypothetical protein